MLSNHTKMQSHHQIPVTGRMPWMKSVMHYGRYETFELTPLPEGRTSVGGGGGGKWVYAIKPGPNGVEKYKAQLLPRATPKSPE